MFAGNSALISPPKLYGSSLVYGRPQYDPETGDSYITCLSYIDMFMGCTALRNVRFATALEADEMFRPALKGQKCFGAVNAEAVFDL